MKKGEKALTWLPFNVVDWLTSQFVGCLSLAAQGAYIRLLAIQWRDGFISDDVAKLARLCGCSVAEFEPIWAELAEKFDKREDGLRNPRLEHDRTAQDSLRLAKSLAGKKGMASRWAVEPKHAETDNTVITELPACYASVTGSVITADNEKEKEKEKEIPPLSPKGEKKRSPKVSAKDRALGVYQFLEKHLRSEDVYKSLLLYFQNGKATLKTEVAYKMLAKKLNEFQEEEVITSCESGIAANHQSLYPKKSDGKRVQPPTKANTPVEVDVEELEWMTS